GAGGPVPGVRVASVAPEHAAIQSADTSRSCTARTGCEPVICTNHSFYPPPCSGGTPGDEREPVDLVGPRIAFATGTAERVDRFADHDVDETGFGEKLLPARTGQPAGNSAGPQIDVPQRLRRNVTAV